MWARRWPRGCVLGLCLGRAAFGHPSEDSSERRPATTGSQDATDGSGEALNQVAATPAVPIEVVAHGAPLTAPVLRVTRDRELLSLVPRGSGSDLLRSVPGVFLTQHSGEGKAHQIFYRGFDAAHGQDLEVSVAGAPVNEVSNVHGQGYADLHFVIPELVQWLEVLPGPFRPDQGDFALAGSARYHLGYDRPGLTTSASLGSFGSSRALLIFHPPDHPSSDFAAVELYRTRGFGVRRAAQRTNTLAQWVRELEAGVSLRVMGGISASHFESPGVLRWDDIQSGRVHRFDSYDLEQGGHSARAQLVTEYEFQHLGAVTRVTPYVVVRDLELDFNYTGNVVDPMGGDHTRQQNRANTIGFTSEHHHHASLLSSRDWIAVGTSLRIDHIQQRQVRGTTRSPLVDAQIDAIDAAGWLGVGVHPVPGTELQFGLRADALWFDVHDQLAEVQRSSSGTHVGPKLGLDVTLAPGWHALFAAGQGFRSPQARSQGDGERTPFTRVHSVEVGTRYAPGRRFSAALSAFASALEDDLVFDETTSRNEIAPGSLRTGVAVDLIARSEPWLSSCHGSATRARFTESDQRFRSGETLPYVPRLVARCDLQFDEELAVLEGQPLALRTKLGQELTWQRPLPYGEVDPGYWLLDTALSLVWSRYELELEVSNLLEATWYDGEFVYPSRFPQANPSLLPRRHVTAGSPRALLLSFTLHEH